MVVAKGVDGIACPLDSEICLGVAHGAALAGRPVARGEAYNRTPLQLFHSATHLTNCRVFDWLGERALAGPIDHVSANCGWLSIPFYLCTLVVP